MINGVERVKRGASAGAALDEFAIIARYFAPLATDKAALGLGDDAAILEVARGYELVVTCDMIIEGVHFLPDDPPDAIAHKALAVNLSDLAAKGAEPYAYLLSLALREASPPWLESFARGLGALQASAGIALIGGDTSATQGPITLTITALGRVPQGEAVLRRGAKPGDRLYVSGMIGGAHLGLRLLQDVNSTKTWGLTPEEGASLIERYQRPEPRIRLASLLRQDAHAAIDISDGLVGDLQKLCAVSGTGAVIEAEWVPLSAGARKACASEPRLFEALITAGDDYEILAAVPEAKAAAFETAAVEREVSVAAIGKIVAGLPDVLVRDGEGRPLTLAHQGYAHFRPQS
jgi:thiamine-monophosphate kinase